MNQLFTLLEKSVKKPIFGCQMCGQCALNETALVCPMNCPKELRNSPCGGVRNDAACEVDPDITCVWVKAISRSEKIRRFSNIERVRPPLNHRLRSTSSWINRFTGRDTETPSEWDIQSTVNSKHATL